jgi:hypothetical protein
MRAVADALDTLNAGIAEHDADAEDEASVAEHEASVAGNDAAIVADDVTQDLSEPPNGEQAR